MSHTIKKNIIISFFIFPFLSFSQYMDDSKRDTLYFLFEKEKCKRKMKFYNKREKGIVFNISCEGKGTFLFSNNSKADTLSIEKLINYKTFRSKDIDSLVTNWYKRHKPGLIAYYGKVYPPHGKNVIFVTYVIEIVDEQDCFVIYPVKWRNEGAID